MPDALARNGLFDGPPIGTWLPDETLFSLASRHHRLSGNHAAETTCLQLFGHERQGSAHDFPSRIDEFVRRTEGSLGDAVSIIRHHTVLPYFLPLRTREIAHTAIAALRGASIGSLKFTLGLLTSRFRAHLPLKACIQCMAEDRARWRVAHWHREHQLPGCWICLTHQAPLLECTEKSTGVGRFSWVLPAAENLRPVIPSELHLRSKNRETLLALGRAAVGLCELPEQFTFDPGRLVHTYIAALQARGLAQTSGRLKAIEIGKSYAAFANLLRAVPELASLPSGENEALVQVRRLLYAPRSGTHPLRHLLLITWLFGCWENLWARYQQGDVPSQSPASDSRGELFHSRHQQERDVVHRMVIQRGRSVSAAAREAGVDPATAMAWLAQAGHASPKRPKLLRGPVRRRVIAHLKKGKDASNVASDLGLSLSTVNRMLRTEVGLHAAWHEARQRDRRRRARSDWTDCLTNNPHFGVKHLRLIAPAAYAWLYRNDSTWLQDSVRALERKTPRAGVRLDWDARDVALAAQVRQTSLTLSRQDPNQRIALWQIYQQLPELKAKLGQLERLPLTRRAIEAALNSAYDDTDQLVLNRGNEADGGAAPIRPPSG